MYVYMYICMEYMYMQYTFGVCIDNYRYTYIQSIIGTYANVGACNATVLKSELKG